MAILTSIVVATAVVAVLLEQVVLAQSAFKLSRVREQVEVAETRHQELLLEVTRLGSPGRIERVAMEELGMVPPDSQRTEYVVANVKGVTGGSLVARSKATRPLQPGTGVAAGTVVEDVP
ncbi:MAG: cell division protein FtsL [Actinomycetota bacterium]|nr:cell division protein FtsL [Actinomycetota bacterium]